MADILNFAKLSNWGINRKLPVFQKDSDDGGDGGDGDESCDYLSPEKGTQNIINDINNPVCDFINHSNCTDTHLSKYDIDTNHNNVNSGDEVTSNQRVEGLRKRKRFVYYDNDHRYDGAGSDSTDFTGRRRGFSGNRKYSNNSNNRLEYKGDIFKLMVSEHNKRKRVEKQKKEENKMLEKYLNQTYSSGDDHVNNSNNDSAKNTDGKNVPKNGIQNKKTKSCNKGKWLYAPPTSFWYLCQNFGPPQNPNECFACMQVDLTMYGVSLEKMQLDLLFAELNKNVQTCNIVQHVINISKQYEKMIRKPTNEKILSIYGVNHLNGYSETSQKVLNSKKKNSLNNVFSCDDIDNSDDDISVKEFDDRLYDFYQQSNVRYMNKDCDSNPYDDDDDDDDDNLYDTFDNNCLTYRNENRSDLLLVDDIFSNIKRQAFKRKHHKNKIPNSSKRFVQEKCDTKISNTSVKMINNDKCPKLLPPWTPTTIYEHIFKHKSKTSSDAEVLSSILKNNILEIYQYSLRKVHTNDRDVDGNPIVVHDPTQHRMMMQNMDRWLKIKSIPPQKWKEISQHEATLWNSENSSLIEQGNKSVYGKSLYLLKKSERG